MTDKHRVIFADPPWPYATYPVKGKGRSADAHYDTMSIADTGALPVRSMTADDSVLFLCVTDPILERAFEVIAAWGFKYKTVGFYWVKTLLQAGECDGMLFGRTPPRFALGLGHWTRANPEMCLLATRGKPHRLNADVAKLIVAPRSEHSVKPDEIYERIERLLAGPYLELFARQRRLGWDVAFSPRGGQWPRRPAEGFEQLSRSGAVISAKTLADVWDGASL